MCHSHTGTTWQPAVPLTHTPPPPLFWVRRPHPPASELTRFTQSPVDVPVFFGGTLCIRGGFGEVHWFTAATYLCEILVTWASPGSIKNAVEKTIYQWNHYNNWQVHSDSCCTCSCSCLAPSQLTGKGLGPNPTYPPECQRWRNKSAFPGAPPKFTEIIHNFSLSPSWWKTKKQSSSVTTDDAKSVSILGKVWPMINTEVTVTVLSVHTLL